MTLSFIQVAVNLPEHPKSDELAALLADQPRAIEIGEEDQWLHVVKLWVWAAKVRPDGSLAGYTDAVIARKAGWRGDPEIFVNALRAVGFLDDDNRLHGWGEWAGKYEARKRAVADAKQAQRLRAKLASDGLTTDESAWLDAYEAKHVRRPVDSVPSVPVSKGCPDDVVSVSDGRQQDMAGAPSDVQGTPSTLISSDLLSSPLISSDLPEGVQGEGPPPGKPPVDDDVPRLPEEHLMPRRPGSGARTIGSILGARSRGIVGLVEEGIEPKTPDQVLGYQRLKDGPTLEEGWLKRYTAFAGKDAVRPLRDVVALAYACWARKPRDEKPPWPHLAIPWFEQWLSADHTKALNEQAALRRARGETGAMAVSTGRSDLDRTRAEVLAKDAAAERGRDAPLDDEAAAARAALLALARGSKGAPNGHGGGA